MLIDGMELAEGSEVENLTVAKGSAFPATAGEGELFFHVGDQKLYCYNGTEWAAAFGSSLTKVSELENDSGFQTAAQVGSAISGKADKSALATVATSGSYNDLQNKPTIPAAYTLPVASATVLGGVKQGANITIAEDGTISAAAGGGAATVTAAMFKAHTATFVSNTAAWQKVPLSVKDYDTIGGFDTTNGRFKPTKAGYYQVFGMVQVTNATPSSCVTACVALNGAIAFSSTVVSYSSANTWQYADTTNTVYLNGTTDYVELWACTNSGATIGASSFLSGFAVTEGTANTAQIAFRAGLASDFSLTSNVWTKAPLATKIFDTNGFFDTTNKRFMPTIAGYYQINFSAFFSGGSSYTNAACNVTKNGTIALYGNAFFPSSAGNNITQGSGLVYMNGTTDYLELNVLGAATGPVVSGNATFTFMEGFLINSTGLSVASATQVGAVKIGDGLEVDANGLLTISGDKVGTKTFTGAVTCNYKTDGSYIAATVTGATTLTLTGVPDSTKAYGMTFELTNAGTNITWPASVSWIGTAPTLRASGISMVTLITRNGGTTWLGTAA